MAKTLRVSRLLESLSLVDARWFAPGAADRGTIVHAIGEQIILGRAVTVAPTYAGYAAGLRKMMDVLGLVPLVVERRLTSVRDGIDGRPDAVGYLPRAVGRIPASPCILDIKSGVRLASHALQLGLYERLVEQDHGVRLLSPAWARHLPYTRICAYVGDDGSCDLIQHDDPNDRQVCAAMLDIARWRMIHGVNQDRYETEARNDSPEF